MTAVLVFAAVILEYRVVMAALTGFALYSVTHFAFHLMHFDGFSVRDAVGVGTGLGIEVVLTFVLMVVAQRLHVRERQARPAAAVDVRV